jgi:hypothetical protein
MSRSGDLYEKPHYTTIAESKAYRNAILSLIPKDVQEVFKQECIKAGESVDMTKNLMEEKRKNCLNYALNKGILIDSNKLNKLTWDELNELSGIAKEGVELFRNSLIKLGMTDKILQTTKEEKTPKELKSTSMLRSINIPSLNDNLPNNLRENDVSNAEDKSSKEKVSFK